MYFRLTRDEKGTDRITEGRLSLTDDIQDGQQIVNFGDINLEQGQTYYFYYKINNSSPFSISDIKLRDENQDDPGIPLDWQMQNQAPGTEEGTLAFTPATSERLNRLEIGQFQQTFTPSETTLKLSMFNEGDNQNPLAQSSQLLNFNQPGVHLKPTFSFPTVQLTGGKTYTIQYEITSGSPLSVKGEAYTLETSWDDALPLSVDRYDALGRIYTPMNFELYEPDTAQKRDSMIQILSDSDYIVIPSNRAYDAMPRLPLRYPMTLSYYQALFDCNCDGNGIENRAYGLEPPFKSPLGFDLVATFESSPNLGFLSIPDQSADESFTVYDHPKVLIFKKSADFSIDKVSALLNSVNLDQVIFQTPLAYTQAPTAMQLPADRLAVQTDGGTWSAMFDRLASINVNEVFGTMAWYLTILLLGWLVFPLVFSAFSGLPDRGYPAGADGRTTLDCVAGLDPGQLEDLTVYPIDDRGMHRAGAVAQRRIGLPPAQAVTGLLKIQLEIYPGHRSPVPGRFSTRFKNPVGQSRPVASMVGRRKADGFCIFQWRYKSSLFPARKPVVLRPLH